METVQGLGKGKTYFRCIECSNHQDLLKERAFVCSACGNLLDVHTDYPKFSSRDAGVYRKVFDRRAIPGPGKENSSGVWRFKELVWPDVDLSKVVTLGEGLIPIVPGGRKVVEWIGEDIEIDFILEGQNLSGSFKDMGMSAMVTLAKAAGALGTSVASTGDTSAAVAAYSAAAGLPCTVLLPAGKITPVQLMQPVAYGARVIEIPGDFDDCMRIQSDLIKLGSYPGNSKNSMRIAGHMATSFLLAQHSRWKLPDWIAAPVGNGSNTTSIGMGMRRLHDLHFVPKTARILGCQTEKANPLARSWRKGDTESMWCGLYHPTKAGDTIATATQIGSPVSFRKVIREISASKGAMQTVTEADIREAMDVCVKDGLPVCPQTGIAVAGLRNAVRSKMVDRYSRVAIVSTATLLKFSGVYTEDVMKAVEKAPDTTTASVAKMLKL